MVVRRQYYVKSFNILEILKGHIFIDSVTTMTKIEKENATQCESESQRIHRGTTQIWNHAQQRFFFEKIFLWKAQITQLSKYCHTSGMDLLTGKCMVMGTEHNLKSFTWDFECVKKYICTASYVSRMIMALRSKLPSQKKAEEKKRLMPGEKAED